MATTLFVLGLASAAVAADALLPIARIVRFVRLVNRNSSRGRINSRLAWKLAK